MNSITSKTRKAAFLRDDEEYLATMSELKLGKKIGEGYHSNVHELEGNPNLVAKVPHLFFGEASDYDMKKGQFEQRSKEKVENIEREAALYDQHGFNSRELFIPTKAMRITHDKDKHKKATVLIRPKITNTYAPVRGTHEIKNVTDSQLITLRKQIAELSAEGFVFMDGIQVGVDRAGRLLLFDSGDIMKLRTGGRDTAKMNNEVWKAFLAKIGKIGCIKTYGEITYEA